MPASATTPERWPSRATRSLCRSAAAAATPAAPGSPPISPGSDNAVMTPVDAQQVRLLKRLRQAAGRPLSFAELRDDGIHLPATVVGELEMHGYAIERVYEQRRMVRVRLVRQSLPMRWKLPAQSAGGGPAADRTSAAHGERFPRLPDARDLRRPPSTCVSPRRLGTSACRSTTGTTPPTTRACRWTSSGLSSQRRPRSLTTAASGRRAERACTDETIGPVGFAVPELVDSAGTNRQPKLHRLVRSRFGATFHSLPVGLQGFRRVSDGRCPARSWSNGYRECPVIMTMPASSSMPVIPWVQRAFAGDLGWQVSRAARGGSSTRTASRTPPLARQLRNSGGGTLAPDVVPSADAPQGPPTPERSFNQRTDALARANEIRSQRAQLKRDLKAGRHSIP
jgi:hypothetical protein